jgi:ABC-type polar amino acid transport system ATPase subunit
MPVDAGNDEVAPVLTVRALHKHFGKTHVLKGVNLSVLPGETTVLIGPSGAGKSSLLRCINFLELPSSGEICVFGKSLCHQRGDDFWVAPEAVLRKARSRMPMVFQQFNLFQHRTVLQNVIEGPTRVQLKPKARAIEEAQSILRRVGLLDKQDSYPDQLSGGQKQRVAIARGLAMEPDLILFDEPTSSLDPELVNEVLSMIRSLAEEARTMIIVTHEMNFARQLADRVHFFADGVITESGTPEEIFDAPRNPRLAEFMLSVLS